MRTAWLPALGLFVLAPVCAEYLWGYDDSTGHPGTLVGNLIVFSPLYGAPALLIREAARRYGLGWPGLLLMAAAFGVLQAGVVDQSMWSTEYRDIPYWHDMAAPTYVGPVGLSIYLAVTFVGGHVILSIGSAVVAVALVVAAVLVGRRPALIVPGTVPRPWQVAAAAFVAMIAVNAIPPSRIGTGLVILLGLGAVAAVRRLSHRGDWDQRHVLALAAGAVLAAGAYAFLTDAIGDVTDAEKYGHNVVLLVLMAGLVAWAAGRTSRGGPERLHVPA